MFELVETGINSIFLPVQYIDFKIGEKSGYIWFEEPEAAVVSGDPMENYHFNFHREILKCGQLFLVKFKQN